MDMWIVVVSFGVSSGYMALVELLNRHSADRRCYLWERIGALDSFCGVARMNELDSDFRWA